MPKIIRVKKSGKTDLRLKVKKKKLKTKVRKGKKSDLRLKVRKKK